jgi:hypothetical protein
MELTDLANQISEMEMNWIRTLYIILISRLDLSVSVCLSNDKIDSHLEFFWISDNLLLNNFQSVNIINYFRCL